MDQTFMKNRSIFPLVISMSLPMVISMLVNALYNIVDSYFVAKISEDAMTALSLVFPLQNTVVAVSIGFGVGVNAVVAYFLGAGDQETVNHTASLGLFLSIIHSIILTIVFELGTPWFLSLYTDNEEVLSAGILYARIVLAFTFLMQLYLVYEKLFQAIGKMKITMVGIGAGALLNIILDPVLIFGLGPVPALGIAGAAYATVAGMVLTLAFYIVLYARGIMNPIHLSLLDGWKSRKLAGRIYAIGIPAILNQGLNSVLITVMNAILAGYSETSIMILGIYYKLQTFIYLTVNGIVQGIRPIVAFNYGAGEMKRVKKIFLTALEMALFVMLVGTLLCQLMPGRLIGFYSVQPATIQDGSLALRIISAGFLISAIPVIVSGTLEGLSKGMQSFVISIIRYVGFILPLAYILSRLFGPLGVWHSFWITEVVAMVVSLYLFRKVY